MKRSYIYITFLLLLYGALVIVFTTFPRSTFSVLEKRDLAKFPTATLKNVASGHFTGNVSKWFSDSEPYRDQFMSLSMMFSDQMKFKLFTDPQNTITFHAAKGDEEMEMDAGGDEELVEEYTNKVTANANAKIAHRGIVIVGEGKNVRAIMAFGGGPNGGVNYAKTCNEYQRVFDGQAQVYCLVIPTAGEFYCPDAARGTMKPQLPSIKNIHNHLDPKVIPVNGYNQLAKHVNEDIYLRTDHHWAPLGAYYVAQEFARVAKVPFRDLSSYEKKVVHGYVGSMYGYSGDIAVKNSPEDFVYYEPIGVDYTTTYIKYTTNENHQVIGEAPLKQGKFFYSYPDGSGGAYCTFMGGDNKITHINTSTKNGRRLLIVKDSFGNALPGYLFFSFEDIHVIDHRYFSKNMVKYVHDNRITDILISSAVFRAYSMGPNNSLIDFLHQPDGTFSGLKGRTPAVSQ